MITRARAYQLRAAIEQAAVSLDDSTALEAVELFPAWAVGRACTAGERLRYEGALYRVEQTHTAQAGWEPPNVPALFTEVAEPGKIPVWRQPTGAQDAYMTGDLVHYPDEDGPVYRSTVDNNVWVPGVYGWTEIGGE